MNNDIEEQEIDENDPRVKLVTKFCLLFKYRDEMYSKLTNNIFEFVQDNVIAAFQEILQLPECNVQWTDAQLSLEEGQEALILSFTLKYTREEANTFIIENFGYEDDQNPNVRLIKFGIPLIDAFTSKDQLIDFILKVTDSDMSDLDHVDHPDKVDFDTSNLTEQQVEQLKLFNVRGHIH